MKVYAIWHVCHFDSVVGYASGEEKVKMKLLRPVTIPFITINRAFSDNE